MGLAQELLAHLPTHLHTHFLDSHEDQVQEGDDSAVHQAGDQDPSSSLRGMEDLKKLEGGTVRVDLLNNNNSQYYGDFALGNPPQRFTAVFDTGSGITWVPGSQCKSDTCSEHHQFSVDGSKSFEELEPQRADGTIHYGTGQVEYADGRDTLTFCDSHSDPGCHGVQAKRLKVQSQPFGMSTNQTDYPFRILPFDGILGLAPSASGGSVVHALKNSHALDRNVFGVYLSEDTHRSGSISFGGIERAHIAPKSPLTWHKIQNDQEWSLAMKDILVDGKPLHICDDRPDGVCPAVVDTGSSLITGPSGEVEKLLSKVRLKDDCSNLAKLPNVSIRIADKDGVLADYPLTPQEYTLKSLDEVPQTGNSEYLKEFPVLGGSGDTVPEVRPRCDPGLGVMDVPGRKWVIGDTFLRRYYSIYDDDRGLVGFAKSIHPDEPGSVPVITPSGVRSRSAMQGASRAGSIGNYREISSSFSGAPEYHLDQLQKAGLEAKDRQGLQFPEGTLSTDQGKQRLTEPGLAWPMDVPLPWPPGLQPGDLSLELSGKPLMQACPLGFGVEPGPASHGEAPDTAQASCNVGSFGHPFVCSAPCKYFWKRRGCKDGKLCVRCHLCHWRKPCKGDDIKNVIYRL